MNDNHPGRWPFIVIRHDMSVNGKPEEFRRLVEAHKRHPGACDEFWFATGSRKTVPELEKELATFTCYRAMCDDAGILFGYQQGLTLGHGERHDGKPKPGEQEFPDDAWQRGRDGGRIPFLCPRSPAVLEYEREYAKTVMRFADPSSYWIDDDLRLGVSKPEGCFCDRCIAAFNAKTGGSWTRETLVARLFDASIAQDPVRAQWSGFNAESLAVYAAAVRKATDELGSHCRLAYQAVSADRSYPARDYSPLLKALSGASGAPVGIRPGHGHYTEETPRGIIAKCLAVAREAERIRECGASRPPSRQDERTPAVASICYEEETYPRRMLHKSPGAIVAECSLAVASGCDSVSIYWFPGDAPMPDGEYDRCLETTVRARPYLERLAASTRRTHLGGVARFVGSAAAETPDFDLYDETDFNLACAGIPVTVANPGASAWYLTDKSLREMPPANAGFAAGAPSLGNAGFVAGAPSLANAGFAAGAPSLGNAGFVAGAPSPAVDLTGIGRFPTAARRTQLLDDLDAATHGAFPVRIDECRALRILPRVLPDGRLDSVTLLNLSIGDTGPLTVRLRNPVSGRIEWQGPDGSAPEPLATAPGATPCETAAIIQNLGPWQIGTVFCA